MILIPMVGASSRFFNAGYSLPKYQLPLWGKTVFHHVMLSFEKYFDDQKFVFVLRNSYDAVNFVHNEAQSLSIKNYSIVVLDELTSGQAETVYNALCSIDDDTPLTIFNIDTIRYGFEYPDFINDCDGYLEVFKGDGHHWSFIEPDINGNVLKTAEKVRISDLCSNGLYFFSKVIDYKLDYSEMLSDAALVNGEFYVAPIYNYSLNRGARIKYSLIDCHDIDFCGTPTEYEYLVTRGPK